MQRHLHEGSATHHPRWLVVLRMALGLCLFAKGIVFMSNSVSLESMLSGSPIAGFSGWLPIVITWANLLGGTFLMIGLCTRWVALIQIPILVGAIIFINAKREGFAAFSELGLAFAVLLLLILFLIKGSGPLSLDEYFHRNKGDSQGTNLS